MAAARKRPPTSDGGSGGCVPGTKSYQPIRQVVVKPVRTLPFTLPNGNRVDLSVDLASLMQSAVIQSGQFAPVLDAIPGGPCEEWIELRSAVSTLDLNVTRIGLRFGYSLSQGETSVVSRISGKAQVQIGLISMDFAIYQCSLKGCVGVGASSVTHRTAGVETSVDIDFGQVTTGPAFVHNSPVGGVLRRMMNQGMLDLAKRPEIGRLGWRATVQEVNEQSGILLFDQGAQSGVTVGQVFEVYAAVDGESACRPYRAVAYVRAIEVNTLSTVAQFERVMGPVHQGDVVTVHLGPSQ